MTAILPYVRDPKEIQPYILPIQGPYIELDQARLALLEARVSELEAKIARLLSK